MTWLAQIVFWWTAASVVFTALWALVAHLYKTGRLP